MQIFGLIGYPLSHSFSPAYFNQKFLEEKIEAEYRLFPIDDINKLPQVIANTKALCGLNVTIPYKEKILPFLDEISPEATQIGAVNTIAIKDTKLIGYNTDVFGFAKTLSTFKTKNSNALIFGTGGASKAVQFVLKQQKIPFTLVSRQPNTNAIAYSELTFEAARRSNLWINCTPIGMFPNVDELLPLPFSALTHNHTVIDLVYNPEITMLMSLAEQHGAKSVNGLEMLHNQAQKAWQLWQT